MPWLAEKRARLQLFRAGDPETLRTAYRVYAPEVMKLVYSGFTVRAAATPLSFGGVADRFQRDDIVQETFIRAFGERARAAYDGLRPYRNYLFAIASRVAVDLYHRELRHSPAEVGSVDLAESLANASAPPDPGPEQALIDVQLNEILERFCDELKPESRELWRLRFEERLSRPLVAERMGLSEMQVRTREARLRTLLFRRLVSHGYLSERAASALVTLLLGAAQ